MIRKSRLSFLLLFCSLTGECIAESQAQTESITFAIIADAIAVSPTEQRPAILAALHHRAFGNGSSLDFTIEFFERAHQQITQTVSQSIQTFACSTVGVDERVSTQLDWVTLAAINEVWLQLRFLNPDLQTLVKGNLQHTTYTAWSDQFDEAPLDDLCAGVLSPLHCLLNRQVTWSTYNGDRFVHLGWAPTCIFRSTG